MDKRLECYFDEISEKTKAHPSLLLQYLNDIQQSYGYIPPTAVERLSQLLTVPFNHICGVIEFYSFLYDEDHGSYRFLFSDNITDRMFGNSENRQLLVNLLKSDSTGTDSSKRTKDINTTSCTGMCDQGPAALINGLPLTRLNKQRIRDIAKLVNSQTPVEDWPAEFFTVNDNIQRKDVQLNSLLIPGESLKHLLKHGVEKVLQDLEESNLRGRGGAGFKTHLKWRLCRETPADERFVVCNADEGEPGTFKDRVLLKSYADDVIEGMTLCARVIGAHQGYIYLRGEYLYLREQLEKTLQSRRKKNLLGNNILAESGWDFDIEIHLGAGSYVCGEESALLESLEGKRGIPRIRPPFPVEAGFRQKPTVVNNVETFLANTRIALNGGEWFRSIGSDESSGTRLLSVSGDCAHPGIYEIPYGITVWEVLELCKAEDTQAVQIAGAAGITVPASEFDRKILFEDLSTGGSFIVFDNTRDLLDMVENFAEFFVHESCGFCTSCRVGGVLMKDLIKKVKNGRASNYDLQELENIAVVMQKTAFCGLGTTAPNPVLDTLQKTPHIYQSRLQQADFSPAFDLDAALEDARQLTGRKDRQAHLEQEP